MAKTKTPKTSPSGKFNLSDFKKSKYLDKQAKFKDQEFIPFSKAFQEIVSMPGIPKGHLTLLRGHSDTGKTTALLEAAVAAQKMGTLPVFIITEMKWNWEHAREMGFQYDEVVDETTGEVVDYEGFFLYIDRGSLECIEDVAAFIADLMNEQAEGRLPHDLCFLWDSIGSIPCRLSITSNKNSNEWNAGAMSQQFGNFLNQKILLSRKTNYPYINTFVAINKVWVAKPLVPMAQPKLKNKGGDTMFFDATLVVTFGNVTNSGTAKIYATKKGKQVEYAKKTKISIDKNHINGVQTKGTIIMTPQGFLRDDKKDLDQYKKETLDKWVELFGDGNFDYVYDSIPEEDNVGLMSNDEE
jgi:hypothetical protein